MDFPVKSMREPFWPRRQAPAWRDASQPARYHTPCPPRTNAVSPPRQFARSATSRSRQEKASQMLGDNGSCQ